MFPSRNVHHHICPPPAQLREQNTAKLFTEQHRLKVNSSQFRTLNLYSYFSGGKWRCCKKTSSGEKNKSDQGAVSSAQSSNWSNGSGKVELVQRDFQALRLPFRCKQSPSSDSLSISMTRADVRGKIRDLLNIQCYSRPLLCSPVGPEGWNALSHCCFPVAHKPFIFPTSVIFYE